MTQLEQDFAIVAGTSVIFLYILPAIMTFFAAKEWLHNKKSMSRSGASVGALWAAIFVPLIGVVTAARWIGSGTHELFRTFFPKKVKLPEARVVTK